MPQSETLPMKIFCVRHWLQLRSSVYDIVCKSATTFSAGIAI